MTTELSKPISFDMSLDDIDDLPQFKTFPSGAYHVVLTDGIVRKEVGTPPKDCAEASMTLVSIEELTEVLPNANAIVAGDADEPPKVGDVMTLLFQLTNETGAGFFKEFLKPIAAHNGTKNIQENVDKSKGLHLMVIIKRTWNKDKERFFGNAKQVAVL